MADQERLFTRRVLTQMVKLELQILESLTKTIRQKQDLLIQMRQEIPDEAMLTTFQRLTDRLVSTLDETILDLRKLVTQGSSAAQS